MTIKELQELIQAWDVKNNVRDNELANMALLTEEIGKLARIMVHRYVDPMGDSRFRNEVSEQIGNILWALGSVANQTGIDLTVSSINTLERKSVEIALPAQGKKKT